MASRLARRLDRLDRLDRRIVRSTARPSDRSCRSSGCRSWADDGGLDVLMTGRLSVDDG